MDILKISQTLVASSVSIYWFCVAVMVIRSRRKFRVAAGAMPKTSFEKRMWMLWAPTVIAWIFLTWTSDNRLSQLLPPGPTRTVWLAGVVTAAATALLSFLLTTRCWMKMGRDWSMAVEPGKETRLITDGPFSRIRHPIYSLSLLLMVSSLIVVANIPMLVVATLHCGLLITKAFNEERYLTRLHGEQYLEYLNRTDRFIPVRALWRTCFPLF